MHPSPLAGCVEIKKGRPLRAARYEDQLRLVAGTVARLLRLFHLCRHFCLDDIGVEARAPLHGREFIPR
jgi:hypothetical protein